MYAPWPQKEPKEQKTAEAKTEDQETKGTKAEEKQRRVRPAPSLSTPIVSTRAHDCSISFYHAPSVHAYTRSACAVHTHCKRMKRSAPPTASRNVQCACRAHTKRTHSAPRSARAFLHPILFIYCIPHASPNLL